MRGAWMQAVVLAIAGVAFAEDTPRERAAEVIAGKREVGEVVIKASWGGKEAVVIYGDGVGVWLKENQFRVGNGQVIALLKGLEKEGFWAMPDRVGGPPKGGTMTVTTVSGEVSVTVGGETKTVVQLHGGEQSPALASVAEAALATGRGVTGISATTLKDGLEKVARKKLSPRVVNLTLYKAAEGDKDGWLLMIDGLEARIERMTAKGPRDAVTRRLTPEAMIGVVRALIAADVSDVPAKVFAEGRYELIVSVLQQRRQVTARPDGPKAKGFDAALRTLDALRRE